MSDTYTSPGFIFSPTGAGGLPTYEALKRRQAMALQLMAHQQKFPQTFGEGLSAIGQAVGNLGRERQLKADEATSQAYAQKFGVLPSATSPEYTPYDPAGGAKPGPQASADGDPWAARSAAIGGIETGGAKNPYAAVTATGTGDSVYGKYQVKGSNIPEWTAAALGRPMTPQQFAADPQAQEAVFRHRFGQYVDRYGEKGAAQAWFAGEKGMQNPNATDRFGRLTVDSYGNDYLKRLGGPRAEAPQPPVRVASADPGFVPGGAPSSAPGGGTVPQSMPPPNPAAGIQPAPPNVQVAGDVPAGARVPVATPAGPPPEMPQPAPPRLLPLAIRPELARIANDPRLPDEYRARALEQIKLEHAQINAMNAQRMHEFNAYNEKWIAQQAKKYDPATPLDLELKRQSVAKGRIPEVKQDVETGLTFNQETGQWEQPRIAGSDPNKKPVFKGTEFQGKALVNYGRARLAHEGLVAGGDEALATSPVQSTISSIPGVRTFASDAYKEANTHAENFVQAFIRQQSGGAYTAAELEKEARSMLPKTGDPPKVIEQKREQREQFLSGLYSVIGPSGQKGVEIDAAKREAEREARPAKDTKAADPLEGREAVFPDKSIRVRRNGQWVPK